MRLKYLLVHVIIFLFVALHLSAQTISVKSSDSKIAKYETFKAELKLDGITYQNPYDPDQVDVQAIFKSPSGKIWKIFGYYDNYRDADKWLLKFCPNESGEWRYSLSVKDVNGTTKSESFLFTVENSGLKGWIKVSDDNPHYFEHDDGSTFFGIGMYYPWHINRNGLDILEEHGANFFGYWNITWDSGTLESMEYGLGKYDQRSAARIDEILEWAEERNMKMLFAIWPHDLLAGPLLNGTGWNTIWDQNPYNKITTAIDFYTSSEAWKYQEKLYRYIIARFGSRRSMGIWEIVNEINGTDGGDNTPEALAWVEKVHNYLKQNDPYNRPTTANQSGGRYWTEGYRKVDIPTIHVYENQFRVEPIPGQPIRSSYTLYHDISKYFRKNFQKPAFMGEAGFTAPENVFGDFNSESAEYDTLYHNALWACWAGGNAATPLWWEFGNRQIVTPLRLKQLKIFVELAGKIDYAHIPFRLAAISAENSDTYGLSTDDQAMGWIIDSRGGILKSGKLEVEGLTGSEYEVTFYNPWDGVKIGTESGIITNNQLNTEIPKGIQTPDIVFFAKKVK
jgi:hypothetical protein